MNLSLTFKADSLIKDTISVSLTVDSLRRELLKTSNDTLAINIINELADRWRGSNSMILADEALLQSEKLKYKFGIEEAKCKQAYSYARSLKFKPADSLANLIISTSSYATLISQATCILGDIARAASQYPKAIEFYQNARKLANDSDDNRIMAANGGLGDCYRKLSEFEKSDSLFDATLNLAEKKHNNLVKIFCTIYKGEIIRAKADYVGAIKYYEVALELSLKMKEKYFIASCYSNMGDLYRLQNDYPNSLRYVSNSLALAKEMKDDRRTAVCYTSIGSIYILQKEFTKGLKYFLDAKNLATTVVDKNREAFCLAAIAEIYLNQSEAQYKEQNADYGKRYELSTNYFKEALKIGEEIGDQSRIAHSYVSIGNIYSSKLKHDSALVCYMKAYEISLKTKDANMEAYSLFVIATTYFELKKQELGMKYAKASLNKALTNTIPMNVVNSAELLYKAYKRNGNSKEALDMHEMYTQMKDSMYNEQQVKKFADVEFKAKDAELVSEQIKKESVYKEDQIKRDAEIKKQKLVRNGLIVGAVLLLGFAFMIYRNLRQSREAQRIISMQKEEVEKQKHIVDEKQKEILDSIYYARRIQQARLPTNFYIDKSLKKLKRDV